jgi:phi LC3 family holin
MNNRWKNYGLWSAITGLILLLLQAFNVPVVSEQYETIVNAILTVLVLAGIINNPTTKNSGFKDE